MTYYWYHDALIQVFLAIGCMLAASYFAGSGD